MLGIAGFMGPFLDYLRPTKSPYLVVAFAAVMVIGFVLNTTDPDKLYRPEFFLPIYILLMAIIPLSLNTQRRNGKSALDPLAVTEPPNLLDPAKDGAVENETVNNPKFENDLDSVFKFSRAFGLAAGVVMMYVYFVNNRPWNVFTIFGYTIILVHMTTFLIYMIFRHFRGEEISNANLFQIAFITVTLLCGATYSALKVDVDSNIVEPFYYCVKTRINIAGMPAGEYTKGCEVNIVDATSITHIDSVYRPDFRQITFAFLTCCWLVYQIFWTSILVRLAHSKGGSF